MNDIRPAKIHIAQQGAIRVNAAQLYKERDEVVCIYVDLHSKRAEFIGSREGDDTAPSVYLGANEETLYLDESFPRESWTEIRFSDYIGWRIFATEGPSRYTLAVCLVAPDQSK